MKNGILTDFHAHILPEADHGSDSLEMSLEQLELISSHGIRTVVATPHFYPMKDNVDRFLQKRDESAEKLAGFVSAHYPEVLIGAEVLVCDGMERMEGLEKLCVFGTKCILLEMPMVKWKDALFDTLGAIQRSGLVPVLAHIDRYDPKYVSMLLDIGLKAQLNPGAFLGMGQRRITRDWLYDGHIVAVGSDLHGADPRSYKRFIKAVRYLDQYSSAVELSMEKLLAGAVSLQKMRDA